ncbi:flagellar hook assembly protein FlgD [Amantichitinum ursilacus]|uniref:Basal-body rod modification protein FlgD n=1 Tax=Amantichitinum ursilacus TaxID=857265 RepID=A0A0N0GPQ5_9NEIS|nr:flagellar hook capping FlgD N-terminal domain-containing protein [Amantichitinum ursilacus]KPC53934.1 Basal-body rod modification protein FlgD [Amantichitinum ursilacus]
MTSSVSSKSFDFSSLNSTSATSSGASGSAAAQAATDQQNQFLKLLVTQLQNQDPTNPMDSAQTTSQLAQISTVTSLAQVNANLQSLLSSSTSGQSLQAASLIGKAVLAPTKSSFTFDGTNPISASVDVPTGTQSMTVQVVNSSGSVVDTFTSTPTAGQMNDIEWDGTDANGNKLAKGEYKLVAKGTDSSGTTNSLTVDGWQQATSVVLGSSGIQVTLGDGSKVNLSDIKQIAAIPSSSSSTSSTSS